MLCLKISDTPSKCFPLSPIGRGHFPHSPQARNSLLPFLSSLSLIKWVTALSNGPRKSMPPLPKTIQFPLVYLPSWQRPVHLKPNRTPYPSVNPSSALSRWQRLKVTTNLRQNTQREKSYHYVPIRLTNFFHDRRAIYPTTFTSYLMFVPIIKYCRTHVVDSLYVNNPK
jgi:hypothetical protein